MLVGIWLFFDILEYNHQQFLAQKASMRLYGLGSEQI
jgi:hypothetical protein